MFHFLKKTSMEALIKKIITDSESFKKNAEDQLKGNKAAGVRARKLALELTKSLKDFRKESVNFSSEK